MASMATMFSSSYFNPRSPHGERRHQFSRPPPPNHFNPRSPHGERPNNSQTLTLQTPFQSTLPARGATTAIIACNQSHDIISIHAPRTGSDLLSFQPSRKWRGISIHAPRTGSDAAVNAAIGQFADISIHAPRTGSDAPSASRLTASRHFNPRSPHGERRSSSPGGHQHARISIHAPRTGSDADGLTPQRIQIKFQSTLPARGATPENKRKRRTA